MARRIQNEESENQDRWLISYADFVTLLLAFFVVMYSVSSVNEGKYRVLSDALVAAFHASPRSMEPIQVGDITKSSRQSGLIKGLVDQGSTILQYDRKSISPFNMHQIDTGFIGESFPPGSGNNVAKGEGKAAINKMADELAKAMSNLIKKDLIAVRRNDLWVKIEIKTSILFPSGSATLQHEALPVLSQIARILKDFPNPIRVEGFTDSVPINTTAFPSNWELSAGRAASVVHLFTGEGVEPRRMAAVGFGEYRPIADNSTSEGRNKNRRVVILILESASSKDILKNFGEAPDGNVENMDTKPESKSTQTDKQTEANPEYYGK